MSTILPHLTLLTTATLHRHLKIRQINSNFFFGNDQIYENTRRERRQKIVLATHILILTLRLNVRVKKPLKASGWWCGGLTTKMYFFRVVHSRSVRLQIAHLEKCESRKVNFEPPSPLFSLHKALFCQITHMKESSIAR